MDDNERRRAVIEDILERGDTTEIRLAVECYVASLSSDDIAVMYAEATA